MADLTRRLSLGFILAILIIGVTGHLFSRMDSVHHAAQEAHCPIHSGMQQIEEKAQTFTHEPVVTIGEIKDTTRALSLAVKISHPPTN